ncbi:GNAT family N-acetyltransferase [Marinobacter daepoensis]|uniref:GNAT family N-acetyltransferase n=1 Tax=Marinobacter daepoensis TaxID=262077 RepID=A0ABS3BD63_9GAMM|nr:GNAT family N-acetyltransferase [Marinobacter daepoensis]MBN7769300.1 GNAT family N-acetyltransferase [Marinobacter daepoensis]MBY6032039.1 GNAT family N-acetyltransferase [Marinobacter daepoensis]MBY6077990.1 GNAT family N-acetyltransferase [Marinobacter daepoensis]
MTTVTSIAIRKYRIQDLSPVVRLFTDSVHELTAGAYDETQRYAWASRTPHLDTWRERLESLETLVAEEGNDLAGFISYEKDGHIDLVFTAPNYARRGIASALYHEAEVQLKALNVNELKTEASVVARPFFERHGFEVVDEQRVTVRGAQFLRYLMRKTLAD